MFNEQNFFGGVGNDGTTLTYNLADSAIADPGHAASSLIPEVVAGPQHGSLSWSGTTFTYTTDGGYVRG